MPEISFTASTIGTTRNASPIAVKYSAIVIGVSPKIPLSAGTKIISVVSASEIPNAPHKIQFCFFTAKRSGCDCAD